MSLTYSGNLVRQHDSDRFFLSLLTPAKTRPALWALFAFNYEIAKTRELVSETTTGLIRLTWWREAIEEIYAGKEPRAHQVVTDLAQAIRDFDLQQEHFETLVFAREFDVEDKSPATLEGLIHYCDYTTTPLSRLALQVIGAGQSDEMVRSASINYALIGLIRSVPYMLVQRRCYLPENILGEHGLSPQKLFDFNQKEKLPGIIQEVMSAKLPYRKSGVRLLDAMNKLCGLYEKQMIVCDYDVFHPSLLAPPAFKQLRVTLGSL